MAHKQTSQDVTIKNWRGYGDIVVPKGTRITHMTACGIDEKYHFVDDLSWIEKNYPNVSKLMRHDATYYGIDIPKEYIEIVKS